MAYARTIRGSDKGALKAAAVIAAAAVGVGGLLLLAGIQDCAPWDGCRQTHPGDWPPVTLGGAFAHVLGVIDPTATYSISHVHNLELRRAHDIDTFEISGSTYAAVAAFSDDGVQILDITDPSRVTTAGSITDDPGLVLDGARGIAVFDISGSTYAAVTASGDDGVQILDITDPSRVTAAGSITDDAGLELLGAHGIAVFDISGSTYAAVTAIDDDGVQILNLTDPHNVTAAGSITDDPGLVLDGARGIDTFEISGSTYAAVAAGFESGVQILDITDPSRVTAAGNITDDAGLELLGALDIDTFEISGSTYAAVTGSLDSGVQILDVTDPHNVTAASSIDDDASLELGRAHGIAVFDISGSTYAAVSASLDNSIQILNLTDPYNVEAAGSIAHPSAGLKLGGFRDIDIFEISGSTYAAVAAINSDGVQMLNVTDPYNVRASGSITDDDIFELGGARDIDTFEISGSTYAAVAAFTDDSVQILDVTDPFRVTAASRIADDAVLELGGARGIAVFEISGSTYAAVAASTDNGVQILNVTDPYNVEAAGSIDLVHINGGANGIAVFEISGSTYAAVTLSPDYGVQILDVTDPSNVTAAGHIADDSSLELYGALGIDIFEASGSTYAAVAALTDDGVQLLNVTDPHNVTAAGQIRNTGSLELRGASGIAVFDISGSTYAAVAASGDDGVQILDITDPHNVTAAGQIRNTGSLELRGALGIDIFEASGRAYAAVAALTDDGVQILDITDPSRVTAAGRITDDPGLVLDGARGIAVFEISGSTYAAVASSGDSGVQIIRMFATASRPPAADAGPDRTVTVGDTVTLAGTATDPDGDPLSYAWTYQPAAPAINLTGSSAPYVTFIAPAVGADTAYTFALTVTDHHGLTHEDQMTLYVNKEPEPPAVDAGYDRTAFVGDFVRLFGHAADPDHGDTLTYAWTNDHAALAVNGANTLYPNFTAPPVSSETFITFALNVTDRYGLSGSDTVTITILPDSGRPPPVAVTPVGGISNGTAGASLGGAYDVATFMHNGTIYAAVAIRGDGGGIGGVQILNLTNPAFPAPAGRIADTGGTLLDSPTGVAAFRHGGHTYAAVTNAGDGGGIGGVQVLNLTDPAGPAAAGRVAANSTAGALLHGAAGIDTFEYGGHTYAAVASPGAKAVQVLNLTDPAAPAAAGNFAIETFPPGWPLLGAAGIAAFESGGLPYAAVASNASAGVLVLNLTDPADPAPAGSLVDRDWAFGPGTDTDGVRLQGAYGIDVFEVSGGHTYAAVSSAFDSVPLQILNLTDPAAPAPAGDGAAGHLQYKGRTAVFESGGTAYAAVTSSNRGDGGVEIYDLTHPAAPRAVGHIADTAGLPLNGTEGITPFEFGGRTMLAVAGHTDDGVQILMLGPPSRPPTVDAGPDQTVDEDNIVILDGKVSDPDGDPFTFSWAHNHTGTVHQIDTLNPRFDVPALSSDVVVAFNLTATDHFGSTATDGVLITLVDNRAPVIDVDPTLDVSFGQTVTIRATVTDPENDTMTYKWRADHILDSSGSNTPSLTFTAPNVTTTITLTLTVRDDFNDEVNRVVVVTVVPNRAPQVLIGYPNVVDEGDTDTLTGTARDPDGDPMTYKWTYSPASPAIAISDDTALVTTFVAPSVTEYTEYTITLRATDIHGNSGSTTGFMAVRDVPNSPPSPVAGADQTVNEGDTVTLTGSATDPEGNPVTYGWSCDAWPSSPDVPLDLDSAPSASPSVTFTAPQVPYHPNYPTMAPGVVSYTCTMTAYDPFGSATDTMTLIVRDIPGDRPVLALIGSISLKILQNSTWTDPGTACSAPGGGGTPLPVTTTGTVDTGTVGFYLIEYSCEHNGHTASATRNVEVYEPGPNQAPNIFIVSVRDSIGEGDGSTDFGSDATCRDAEDGLLPVSSSVSFHAGGQTATITYTCRDSGGLAATTSQDVTVLPSAPPGIYLNWRGIYYMNAGDAWTDPGAYCIDAEDGRIPAPVDRTNLNATTPGRYVVIYECTDSDGNTEGTVLNVFVRPAGSNLPPVLVISDYSDIRIPVNGTLAVPPATCTDKEDGDLTALISMYGVDRVDTTKEGVYRFTYFCEDGGGEQVQATVRVFVGAP